MHRLGHVGQMQRRAHAEEMLCKVVLCRVGINATHQLGAETDALLDGESTNLLLYGEKQFVVKVGEPSPIGTVNIVFPLPGINT